MNRYLSIFAFLVIAIVGAVSVHAETVAATAADQDSLFVYMADGRLDVYPSALIKKREDTDAQVVITTIDDKQHVYPQLRIESISNESPKDKPTFTSFKFNNKFNGQVYQDVECEIGADGLITASVPAIGKWLTPSFQRSDDEALVYVGRQLQRSKVTRRSFADLVEYVVTRPGWQVMTANEDTEEVVDPEDPEDPDEPTDPIYSELDDCAKKLGLTADMLSTNAPTTRTNEDLPMIIDGRDETYFHSTWSGSGYPTLPLDSCPWIEVKLPESVHRLQLRYETRDSNQRWPVALRVDVSKDGETWTAVQEFTAEEDGLPEKTLEWWTSPVIDLSDNYDYFRLVCTKAAYKNYLCLAELELYKIESLFSNNKLYTITCKRGGLVLNDDGYGLAAGQTRFWATDEEKRFAILDIKGQNYLYSPVNKGFFHYDGSFVQELGSPIFFDDNYADEDYLYMISTEREDGEILYFNNNSKEIVINSWNTPDNGDRWKIEAVADFDPTEALKLAGVDDGNGTDPDPTPDPQTAGSLDFQPYGTKYTVSVDWPTDRSTNVPAVYITTDCGRRPYDKSTYLTGTLSIDGAGVFPDMEEMPMQIKGRGNSSWAGEYGKSPYRLKFDEKVKPFGMTKSKSWVLLANRISNSMMTNAIGMKVAQLAGAAGANHIVPVELYINDEYAGSYNFTEKVGFHNNSIDLDDETYAAMLELDTYSDETIYRADYFNVPVKIHDPEFSDPETVTPLTPEDIMADFNEMLSAAVDKEDISRWVQVDTFSAFYLTNEYIMNQELMHPKSTFLYKERVGDASSLWKFGPVWDLDWGFGHEMNGGYFTTGATSNYVNAKSMECNSLWRNLRAAGETLDRAYYKAWTRFLRQGAIEELNDFCQEYYDYANPSFQHNAAEYWDGGGRDYGSQVPIAQKWLKTRAEYIYKTLTAYDLSEELPEDEEWKPYVDEETPIEIDVAPYIHVRTALQNLMADAESYTCNPTSRTPLENVILEQNAIVAKATSDTQVVSAVAALRAATVAFLGDEELIINKPLDLTEILLTNSAPVENTNGWTCSVQPNAFDPSTQTAEFWKQSAAEISQSVSLPAGNFELQATALTRTGFTSYLFVDQATQQLIAVDKSKVDTRAQARQWFDEGNGINVLAFSLDEPATKVLGLRADADNGDHWTVWSDFALIMTGKETHPTVTNEQYEMALSTINPDLKYRIFTTFDGTTFTDHKYYLSRSGHLTDKLDDSDVYTFNVVVGQVGEGNNDLFVSPGWKTDACFTNPTLSGGGKGDIVPSGYISTNVKSNRDNWEGQVWYKDGELYAVRSTNSPAGSWGAETFWTVEDIEGDGFPEAGYSWDPGFYWQLEEYIYDRIDVPETLAESLDAAPVYDLAGRRIADRFDHFRRQHRPGVYLVGGRKVTIK